MLKLVFYVCSLDLRVRPTYSLNQILSVISEPGYESLGRTSDWIEHFIQEELIDLAILACRKDQESEASRDSVELYNILICGAFFYREEFVTHHKLRELICGLVHGSFSYFRYIALKFVMLVAPSTFRNELTNLNDAAEKFILNSAERVMESAEVYLTLCDYLSSPDVDSGDKVRIWRRIFGGDASKAEMEELAHWVGFADWDGIRIEHTLRRKTLRPAYE